MTTEQFSKILPCYLGKQAITHDSQIGTLYSVETCGDVIIVSNEALDSTIGKFKLLLRKMEDMTDDEYTQFALHMNWAHFDVAEFTLENEICEVLHNYRTASKAINYLRSIGVDVDGLIEAGYAVHQKEVTT